MRNPEKKLQYELRSMFEGISTEGDGETRVTVKCRKETVITMLSFLKKTGFDHLALISCVDRINNNELELVYILSSYGGDAAMQKLNILVKTRIPRENPQFYTATEIFRNASPYERELHELFGIFFRGHPGLTPLFLEREYDIPPFRKDFDTRKYVKDVFDQIPFVDDKKGRT
ncbi:MAG TPA: NADH-quinone oxidoreductase subunit C [Bacteroidetes bacterium]|nr:NADH-quinone oxidoreductase subunit C [Bacteroidota bacterium]